MPEYDPFDWHWVVADDEGRWWSSASGAYVTELPEGAVVTPIGSETELAAVLKAYGLRGPLATISDVKAEAGRRIEAIMPDYAQRNALALGQEMVLTYGPDPTDWPVEQQAVLAEMMAKWASIKAIRAKSDELEAMSPIPLDYTSDKHWTD